MAAEVAEPLAWLYQLDKDRFSQAASSGLGITLILQTALIASLDLSISHWSLSRNMT